MTRVPGTRHPGVAARWLGVLALVMLPAHAQDEIPDALAVARPLDDTAPSELLERTVGRVQRIDVPSNPGWALEAMDLAASAAVDLGRLQEAEEWANQRLGLALAGGDAPIIANAHQDSPIKSGPGSPPTGSDSTARDGTEFGLPGFGRNGRCSGGPF